LLVGLLIRVYFNALLNAIKLLKAFGILFLLRTMIGLDFSAGNEVWRKEKLRKSLRN
jgi:hypothetical protein